MNRQWQADLEQELKNLTARAEQRRIYNISPEEPMIIDHEDRDFCGNERILASRIRDLERKLEAVTGGRANTMTAATIRHEQDIVEQSSIHKAIGISNRVVLCGLTGNMIAGPVIGYLTDNFWMLAVVELFAVAIWILGIIIRPDRKDVVKVDQAEIRSRHLLADATNSDSEKHLPSNSKDIAIRGAA